jgi:hypothetical protein
MRPVDIERELERLSIDASTARAQIGEMRNQLGRARTILDEIRRLLVIEEEERRPVTDSTPGAGHAQGEAV